MSDIDLNLVLKLIDNASDEFKKINSDSIKQLSELKGAEEGITKTTALVNSSFKDLGKTLNSNNSAYDDLSRALDINASAYDDISKVIKSMPDDYDNMSRAIAESRNVFESFSVEINKRVQDISSKFSSLSDRLKETSKEIKTIGRDISQLGSTLSILGASITAVFIKALSDSSKYSTEVQKSIQDLNTVSTQFSVIIAQSVVPIINNLTSLLQLLLNAFNSMSPQLRESILQWTLWGGIILTAVGSLTFLGGKIIVFISNLYAVTAATLSWTAANIASIAPMIAIASAIGGIIFLMLKFKPVADTIANAFEISFNVIKSNILIAKIAIEEFLLITLQGLARVFEGLAHLPNQKLATEFTNIANSMINASGDLRVSITRDNAEIEKSYSRIGNILTTGQGEWSVVFQDIRTKALEAKDAITGVLTGIKTPQINQDQNIINIINAQNEIRNFNDELSKQKDLFITGKISADEYYRILIESQQSVIGQNQQLEQELQKLATSQQNATFKMSIAFVQLKNKLLEVKDALEQGIGQAFAKMVLEGESFSKSLKELFKSVAETFIAEVGRMIAKWLAFLALKAVGKFFGFNEGSGDVQGLSQGSGRVQGFNSGGFVNPLKLANGTDTIPALLSPGEIVVPRSLSDSIRQGELSLSGPKDRNQTNNEGDVYVNIYYPKLTSKEEMMELVNNIGSEIQKQMRYART